MIVLTTATRPCLLPRMRYLSGAQVTDASRPSCELLHDLAGRVNPSQVCQAAPCRELSPIAGLVICGSYGLGRPLCVRPETGSVHRPRDEQLVHLLPAD